MLPHRSRPLPPDAPLFHRAPHLQQTEVLQARYVTHVFPKHTHEEFAMGVVDGGVHVSEWGGVTHRTGPGAIVVNNPGDIHTGRAGDATGWSYRMLYPPAALLEDVATQIAGRSRPLPAFGAPVIHDAAAAAALRALIAALLDGAEPLETHTRFLLTVGDLLRRHAVDRPPSARVHAVPDAVRRAREYLEAHADESVALADLSRVTGLHPLYLVRVFHRAVGLPPHAYLTQIRVQRAKRRLAAGEPAATVAATVGFAEQSHLTRHFKRQLGVTPGQYARALGATAR
jgi:AraC-like DNA-binding protein